MAGETDVVEKLKQGGYQAHGKTFKNHIDGFNLLPYLTGEVDKSPRNIYFYFSDDGDVLGVRWDNWKVVFMEQRLQGTMGVWAEPFIKLRVPKVFNLRTDPYEFAETTSNSYWDWVIHQPYAIYPVLAALQKFMGTFKEFPPAQRPDSLTVEKAAATLQSATGKAS